VIARAARAEFVQSDIPLVVNNESHQPANASGDSALANKKRTGYYVPSTHWDREWYESFQDYRFRLVKLLDEVFDTLKRDDGYRCFQMDGQSIAIEDYLEIRPERRDEVVKLAKEGRFRLGPWYVLPDEFLVSGESLVRNIGLGLKVAAEFGPPSRAGFMCDMFGHTSQMPQILQGFSIDNALLWRGVNEETHGGMFHWEASDGTSVITYRFSPKSGYCSYAFIVRHAPEPDAVFDIEKAMEDFRNYLDFETKRCPTDAFLVFDGGDHLEILPETTELLARANKTFDDVELVHTDLDTFMAQVRRQTDRIERRFKGELRDPARVDDDTWLIPGVLSSRVHLKQSNARCENELCLWAEPFSTFASLKGWRYPFSYIEQAWRHLIQNHPHDSMCACSIDQVHKDMEYRFDQSLGISSHVSKDAMRYLADRIKLPELDNMDFAITVFNPTSRDIDGPVDITIRFPEDIDAVYQEWFGFEKKIGFRLFDQDDHELPYQYVNQRKHRVGFRRPYRKFPAGDIRHEVDVSVSTQIPAYGYTTLICRPVKEPTRHLGSMVVNDHTIENEHLRVAVQCNGTIELTDKRNSEVYRNLLTMEERADIGDGWFHGVAVNDQVFTSSANSADVAITADGIHKATLMITVRMSVPAHFTFSKMERASHDKTLMVRHYVTLRKDSSRVEVHTEVENNARDHRLRVLFPSGANAETFLADQAFDVVERPIALREDNAQLKELEVETKPQQTWTAVHDDRRGLAVVSTGLPESTVRDLPERPVALTLLRSFIKAVMTSGNVGGQIQGRHHFDYWIVPLAGEPDRAALCHAGQSLAGGVRSIQIEQRDVELNPVGEKPQRDQPMHQSLLQVDASSAVITAVHRRDENEAASVRMFNPAERKAESSIKFTDGPTTGELTDLEGTKTGTLSSGQQGLQVELEPKRIATVKLTS
jgi:alpha-mannosidase/mannosylglycerate hydrolase